MAVFTPVAEADAEPFISRYGLGGLRSLTPIAEGVQNTNYQLDTDRGRFVLTLVEGQIGDDALPFCLGLTEHAAAHGMPTARPVRNDLGQAVGILNRRPAAILEWLPGTWSAAPSLSRVKRAGAVLARLHLACADFPLTREDPVGARVRRALFERCGTRAGPVERLLLDRIAPWVAENAPDPAAGLPRGPIHADYFPDNLLFEGDEPAGLIDFYFACTGAWAYDLAIALAAWGFDADGQPLPAALEAFQAGYESIRPLNRAERAALPDLCAIATVRFTLTRLHDRLFHDPTKLVTPKDPVPFLRRLDWWRGQTLTV